MTASSTRENYTNIVHEAEVDGGWSGRLRVVRATGANGQDLVFVDSDLLGAMRLVLTPEEAVDFAEAIHNTSGMQASTYQAQFLAPILREAVERKGLTRTRVCELTGIPLRRLRRIFSGEVPITHDEHVAISEVLA